jgi:transcriptional regulator with XRE-family HTH domain
MKSEFPEADLEGPLGLGTVLRRVRTDRRLTLQGVEDLSNGVFKAAILGAYERGTRAMTVDRLLALAELYGVPVSALLPRQPGQAAERGAPATERSAPATGSRPVILDARRIRELAASGTATLLDRWIQRIQRQRANWDPLVPIRGADVEALAALHDCSVPQLLGRWDELGATAGPAVPEPRTPPDGGRLNGAWI